MHEIIRKKLRIIDLSAAGALVLIILLITVFGVVPVAAQARRNKEETQNIHKDLRSLDTLSLSLARVQVDLTAAQNRLNQAEARLPNSRAMDEFMVQLAKVAEDSGLQVDAISPKKAGDAGTYKTLPIELAGTGSFDTCYKFLTGLRKMPRLTRLDDLVLQLETNTSDHDKGAAKPVCRISVLISTFVAG